MTEGPHGPTSTTLGRTDIRVSKLGIGAMVWGDMSTAPWWSPARSAYGPTSTADDQRAALEVSLAAGVNFLDTAAMYGKGVSERRVGELTKDKDLVVATKFPFGNFSRERSLPVALDESLHRLQRARIDLYQIHYPFPWMSIRKLMNLLADAVEAGKIRAAGVSNYSAKQMRTAHAELARRGLPLASNQVQYSLLHRDPDINGVLDTCRELDVTLIAYMPLAAGALTGKYSATTRPAGWRRYMRAFPREEPRRPERTARVAPRDRPPSRHRTEPGRPALADAAGRSTAHCGGQECRPGEAERRSANVQPRR